jgi:hypothetical protein
MSTQLAVTSSGRVLAGGRADLLAQVAGIFEGTSDGEPDEPLARCAADLCRTARADQDAIPAWIEEGRLGSKPAVTIQKRSSFCICRARLFA